MNKNIFKNNQKGNIMLIALGIGTALVLLFGGYLLMSYRNGNSALTPTSTANTAGRISPLETGAPSGNAATAAPAPSPGSTPADEDKSIQDLNTSASGIDQGLNDTAGDLSE